MKSIKRNFIYNSIYQILLILLPLITTPYISRVLMPEAIGKYAYWFAISNYYVIFSNLGLSNYGNRTIAACSDDYIKRSQVFSEIFSMQLLIAMPISFIYFLQFVCLSDDVIAKLMFLYVLSSIIDVNWFFYGIEEFKLITIRNIIIKTVATILIFVFVNDKKDLWLYALFMAASYLISQMSILPFLKKYIRFNRVGINDVLQHLKPNLILFIPVIAISLYKYMDKIMLGMMSSDIEVGLYESADKIVNVPMALVTSLGAVMLPRMSNMFAKGEEEQANKYIETSIYFVMFVSCAICFGIMSVSSIFVPVFFGYGYSKCILLMQILLPSCIFLAFANVLRTQYLIPKEKDKIYVVSVVLGAVVNLIVNVILIPHFQSIGAAWGTLFAQASVCIYQAICVKNKLNIKKYVIKSLPFIFTGFIMYISLIYMISKMNLNGIIGLLISSLIGMFIYIFVMIIEIEIIGIEYTFITYFKNKYLYRITN